MSKRKFGSELRAVRRRLGLTPEKLAAQIGVSGDSVRLWEKGAFRPSVHTAEKLARFFETIGNDGGGDGLAK